MRRLLPALAVSSALVLGGCQNPNGSVNWGNTLLLGAGIGAATALVAGAAADNRPHRYASGPHHRHGARYGYRNGYGRW
jgi:hypothetical protein